MSISGGCITGNIDPVYDNLGRTTQKTVDINVNSSDAFYNALTYSYKTASGNQTSLISQIVSEIRVGSASAVVSTNTYNYTYDELGNITQISDASGTVQNKYYYDDLGQLIREDNRALNASFVYAYDNAGNITSKAKYAFTTGTLGTATETEIFTYSSSTWGDKLTGHGENTFEYDAIGNPIRIGYYEGGYWYSGYDLTWQGRQLMSYTPFDEVTGDTSSQTSVSYTYNVDGIRTSKTVDGIEHRYLLDGVQIVSETWTTGTTEHLIVYIYDENGAPIGLRYRTNSYAANTYDSYFFDKNLQGDIIAIYNASGTKIGSYTYDAWGVCTATTHTSSSLERTIVTTYNPFRYRGYYYDVETELYYLQTRYYNPEICRFLNVDVYISTGQGFLGYNMFAYCLNNPVSRKDRFGTDSVEYTDGEPTDYHETNNMGFSPGAALGGNNLKGSGSVYNFQNEQKLQEHYKQHNREMFYKYNSADEYLADANEVIRTGQYVPEKNAYVRLINDSGNLYYFVGLTHDHRYITTFHIKRACYIF